jgi:Rieske Fe-S protein
MTDAEQHPTTPSTVGRRTVFRGLAVGGVALPLLAACGGGTSGGGDSSASSSGSSPGDTLATSDVPVGGGTVLAGQKVVVTQPAKGDFKAFTAVCTHQGCIVSKVEGGQIVCPCHGSHFSIEDGSPVSGPASSPLAARKISVAGDRLTVG